VLNSSSIQKKYICWLIFNQCEPVSFSHLLMRSIVKAWFNPNHPVRHAQNGAPEAERKAHRHIKISLSPTN
jgi:hypothetical protein